MKLATTTEDFLRFYPDTPSCLREIRNAGFRFADLSLYDPVRHAGLLCSDQWEAEVLAIKQAAEEIGITLVQSHSPAGNALDPQNRDSLLAMTLRSIQICGMLSIPCIVVHAGCAGGIGQAEFYERNRAFYRLLLPEAERWGVRVLTENSTKANLGGAYYFLEGADMKQFVDYVDHPLFGACWDTGHGNIEGGQYEQILALGDALCALHVNDNRGSADEHILPYFGTLNPDDLMQALVAADYRGAFTFEAGSTLRPSRYWLGDRRPAPKPGPLSEPDLALQRGTERLMYLIGTRMLQAYGIECE